MKVQKNIRGLEKLLSFNKNLDTATEKPLTKVHKNTGGPKINLLTSKTNVVNKTQIAKNNTENATKEASATTTTKITMKSDNLTTSTSSKTMEKAVNLTTTTSTTKSPNSISIFNFYYFK